MGLWRWAIIFRSRLLDMSSDTARHITGKLPSGPGSKRITSFRRALLKRTEQNQFNDKANLRVYQAGALQNRRPGRLPTRRAFARGLVGAGWAGDHHRI